MIAVAHDFKQRKSLEVKPKIRMQTRTLNCGWFAISTSNNLYVSFDLCSTGNLWLKIFFFLFQEPEVHDSDLITRCISDSASTDFDFQLISDPDMVDLDSQPVCGFALKSGLISDPNMINFDSQTVCGVILNLFTRFLSPIGWLGLSGCAWFILKSTDSISDPNWLIRTLSLCVVWLCSLIYSIDLWPQHDWFELSVRAWFAFMYTHSISDSDMVGLDSQLVRGVFLNRLIILTPIGRLGFSGCAWFTLKTTHSISDPTGWLGLSVCAWFLLTRLPTLTWLIWTLRLCVVCSGIYSLDFWLGHVSFGLSDCTWFALKSTHSISDPIRLIWALSLCVVSSRIFSLYF